MSRRLLIFLLPLSMLLAACGRTSAATPSMDSPAVFTAVAGTLTALPTFTRVPTATPEPSRTSTLTLTPTVGRSPTALLTATQTPWPYITWTPSQCDHLQFIADLTIPDGTKIYPGAKFTKTWKVYNSGTCAWTKDYRLTYISGNPMGADTFNLPKSVPPGGYMDISIEFTAPDIPEDYSNFWRLRNPAGEIFGATLYAIIEVSEDVKTPTPTNSPTVESTSTAAILTETATPTVRSGE